MSWLGNRTLEDTFYFHFSTRRFSSGATFTLAGTPSLSAYEDASDTQITAGLTLAVDADSKTGFNRVTVVATAANGYEAGKDYTVVIEAGTVDSVSVVGEVVGAFRIGPAPANLQQALGTALTETAGGRLSAAIIKLFDVATPTLVASDVMRGTDSANTTVPDVAGTAPTAVENRQEMDSNSTKLAAAALEATLTAMKGATFSGATDSLEAIRNRGDSAWPTATGFNTVEPDPAGTAPTAAEIMTALLSEIVEDEGSITFDQFCSTILAVIAGQTADDGSTFKTPDGAKTRVDATVNASQERTAVTLTPDA